MDLLGGLAEDVTSSPREVLRTCEDRCCVRIHTGFSHSFKGLFRGFCQPMIIESRTMASSDEEDQLGQESEDESELSDGQVSSS